MSAPTHDDPAARLEGLIAYPNGQWALCGQLLELHGLLDACLRAQGRDWGVREHHFPTFLPVEALQRAGYLTAFPHHTTFALNLAREEDNLDAFCAMNAHEDEGDLTLVHTDPVADVLTPAACYHFYLAYRSHSLHETQYLTTSCTCHRRESYYAALRRQWSFTMRELVALGREQDVARFVDSQREHVAAFAVELGLEATWQPATDPFFQPERHPAYAAQRALPIKEELVIGDGLAIASVNRHGSHFGDAFEIGIDDGPAHSGCVAFGLERWLYALAARHGTNHLATVRAALERLEATACAAY